MLGIWIRKYIREGIRIQLEAWNGSGSCSSLVRDPDPVARLAGIRILDHDRGMFIMSGKLVSLYSPGY